MTPSGNRELWYAVSTMSVNITVRRTDKLKADALLDSILDGSFQAQAHKRIPELFEELEKYPPITDEEVYMPKFNTPEARQNISERIEKRTYLQTELKRYVRIPRHIDEVNKLRNTPESEDYYDWVRSLADDVVSLNSTDFYSPLWEVQVCVDLLFKYAGFKPEDTEALENVPFDAWCSVFNDLSRDLLMKVKDEVEANQDEYGSFEDFVTIIKEIRDIQRGCDGVSVLFSVTVEGEGDRSYEISLEERIKEFLKSRPIDPIDLKGKSINVFE